MSALQDKRSLVVVSGVAVAGWGLAWYWYNRTQKTSAKHTVVAEQDVPLVSAQSSDRGSGEPAPWHTTGHEAPRQSTVRKAKESVQGRIVQALSFGRRKKKKNKKLAVEVPQAARGRRSSLEVWEHLARQEAAAARVAASRGPPLQAVISEDLSSCSPSSPDGEDEPQMVPMLPCGPSVNLESEEDIEDANLKALLQQTRALAHDLNVRVTRLVQNYIRERYMEQADLRGLSEFINCDLELVVDFGKVQFRQNEALEEKVTSTQDVGGPGQPSVEEVSMDMLTKEAEQEMGMESPAMMKKNPLHHF